jgi:hypothetical protein
LDNLFDGLGDPRGWLASVRYRLRDDLVTAGSSNVV